MKKVELHHASLKLTGDIPCYKFDSIVDLEIYLSNITDNGKIVYLGCMDFDESSIIFIDNRLEFIAEFYCKMTESKGNYTYYLQEYASYEEAYKVALMMKEMETDLTYEN